MGAALGGRGLGTTRLTGSPGMWTQGQPPSSQEQPRPGPQGTPHPGTTGLGPLQLRPPAQDLQSDIPSLELPTPAPPAQDPLAHLGTVPGRGRGSGAPRDDPGGGCAALRPRAPPAQARTQPGGGCGAGVSPTRFPTRPLLGGSTVLPHSTAPQPTRPTSPLIYPHAPYPLVPTDPISPHFPHTPSPPTHPILSHTPVPHRPTPPTSPPILSPSHTPFIQQPITPSQCHLHLPPDRISPHAPSPHPTPSAPSLPLKKSMVPFSLSVAASKPPSSPQIWARAAGGAQVGTDPPGSAATLPPSPFLPHPTVLTGVVAGGLSPTAAPISRCVGFVLSPGGGQHRRLWHSPPH